MALIRKAVPAVALVLAGWTASQAQPVADPWPPSDPADPQATVAFTTDWAAAQRDLHDINDLQAATGSPGRITAFQTQSETPRVVFEWTGLNDRGHLRAFVYRDGRFGALVSLADGGGEVVFNTFGAFVCPTCSPPVNACGRRPSWVPHDLHWDTFDCDHTLTGPQSLIAPGR